MCDFQEARIEGLEQENEKLKEKLDIAVSGLETINSQIFFNILTGYLSRGLSYQEIAEEALEKIKEIK